MTEFTQIAFDEGISPVPIEEVVFDYRLLSEDKREFVLQKTDETKWLLKRTAENTIQIGLNLEEVSENMPHGMYLSWLKSEFELSRQTADRFRHVAAQFGNKMLNLSNLATSALYLLAAPNTPQAAVDEAIQRSQDEKITHALAKKIVEAHETVKEAQQAAANARADAIEQQVLFENEKQKLLTQIETLRKEKDDLVKPDAIEKEVIPQEILDKQAEYEKEIEQLTQAFNNEKERADGYQQRMLDETERARKAFEEERKRSREKWLSLSTKFQLAAKEAFSQWPTPLDIQAFEENDWNEIDHMIEAAHQVIEACNNLRVKSHSVIIDSGRMMPYVVES